MAGDAGILGSRSLMWALSGFQNAEGLAIACNTNYRLFRPGLKLLRALHAERESKEHKSTQWGYLPNEKALNEKPPACVVDLPRLLSLV